MWTTTRYWAASLAVFFAASGCTGAEEKAPKEITAPATEAPVADSGDNELFQDVEYMKSLVLTGIDEYVPSLREHQRHYMARSILIEKCMARYGHGGVFDAYDPPESYSRASEYNEYVLVYGVVTDRQAETRGYQQVDVPNAPHTENGKPKKFPPAAEALYSGSPQEGAVPPADAPVRGCLGEATRAIVPDEGQPGAEVQQYRSLAFDKAYHDPDVEAVFAKWSACMKEKGYTYANPLDAGTEVDDIAEQIPIAKADMACKKKTKLLEVWPQRYKQISKEILEQNPEVFATEKQKLDEAEKRIADILQEAGRE